MKISVVMVMHNREDMVHYMIEDILGQTFSDFEFIIVDNHSIDKSGEIAREYARADSRIKLIYLERDVSIGAARNRGIACAEGEYIAFVDDDDRVEKDFLEFLNKMILLDPEADCAVCGVVEKSNGMVSPQCVFEGVYIYTASEAARELLKREKIRAGMPAKLIRRDILVKYPFAENCRHEDIHNTYKFLSEVRKAVISGIPKYCAVRHKGNLSAFTGDDTQLSAEQLEEYLDAFRERTEFIKIKLPDIADLAQYSEWSYMVSMCKKIIENSLDSCEFELKKMVDELKENRETFITSVYIKDFEKEWMKKYISSN